MIAPRAGELTRRDFLKLTGVAITTPKVIKESKEDYSDE